jgi:hypothetical protein
MERPLILWAKLTLRLGLVLLAIGAIPALLVQYVFTTVDALIPGMLLILVAPLGAVITLVALILFLAAWLRRPPGPF